jgi:hypothetical protein
MSCFSSQRTPLEANSNPYSHTGKSAHISLWLSTTEFQFLAWTVSKKCLFCNKLVNTWYLLKY